MRNAITSKNTYITHLKHRCTKENPSHVRARNPRALARALATLARSRARSARLRYPRGRRVRRGARSAPPSGSPLPPFGTMSSRCPRNPPRRWRGASCLLRAGETPALRRQGDAKRLRSRIITSSGHSLDKLARAISRSSGVNDHAALLRSRSVRLGSRTALPCRVNFSAASHVAVVALRWLGLPPSPAQGCARWAQRPCGARVGACAPRGSLRSPRRYDSAISGLPSIFCGSGAVALPLKYR